MTNELLDALASTLGTYLGTTVRKGTPRIGQLSGEPPATSIAFVTVADTPTQAIGGVRRQWEWQCVHLAVNEDELLTAIVALLDLEQEEAELSVGIDKYNLTVANLHRHANKSGTDAEEYGIDFTITTTA